MKDSQSYLAKRNKDGNFERLLNPHLKVSRYPKGLHTLFLKREKAAKNTNINPLTPHNRLPVEDRVSVDQNLYAFLPSWPWHEKVPCDLNIVCRRLKEGHAISEPSNQSRDGNVQLCIG